MFTDQPVAIHQTEKKDPTRPSNAEFHQIEIREAKEEDLSTILEIINDSAKAYRGKIPEQLYKDPYMTSEYLHSEIEKGVIFFLLSKGKRTLGVMGIQEFNEVQLIRHSYVRTSDRGQGVGSALLRYHKEKAKKPVIVGCLKAMHWAIKFYEEHGFKLVDESTKNELRKRYWSLSQEHVKNSVVLADEAWWSTSSEFVDARQAP